MLPPVQVSENDPDQFPIERSVGYDADDFKADATDMSEVTTSDVLRELENDLFGEALDPQDERCLQYAVKYPSGLTLYG